MNNMRIYEQLTNIFKKLISIPFLFFFNIFCNFMSFLIL